MPLWDCSSTSSIRSSNRSSLPLTIITLGIFQLVLNSFMLELASYLSVNLLGVGISIAGFGSAFMGSILVSIMRSILDSLAED